jgi:hypothetical protein
MLIEALQVGLLIFTVTTSIITCTLLAIGIIIFVFKMFEWFGRR